MSASGPSTSDSHDDQEDIAVEINIAGHDYTLFTSQEQELGRGAYGVVSVGQHIGEMGSPELVAIKQLDISTALQNLDKELARKENLTDEEKQEKRNKLRDEIIAEAEKETRIMSDRLGLHAGMELVDDKIFMVMPLVQGVALKKEIERVRKETTKSVKSIKAKREEYKAHEEALAEMDESTPEQREEKSIKQRALMSEMIRLEQAEREADKEQLKLRRYSLVLFKNLLSEVENMHACGIIHSDLHDNNVLVNPDTLEVTIIDFGLSHEVDPLPYDKLADEQAENRQYQQIGIVGDDLVANDGALHRPPESIHADKKSRQRYINPAMDYYAIAMNMLELMDLDGDNPYAQALNGDITRFIINATNHKLLGGDGSVEGRASIQETRKQLEAIIEKSRHISTLLPMLTSKHKAHQKAAQKMLDNILAHSSAPDTSLKKDIQSLLDARDAYFEQIKRERPIDVRGRIIRDPMMEEMGAHPIDATPAQDTAESSYSFGRRRP